VPRLAVDHNFDGRIVAGLLRRMPDLDVVHVRDVGLAAASDPLVLEWAAREDRVLLTHDRRTLVGYAYERLDNGKPMSGVIVVDARCQIGPALVDVILLLECIPDHELSDRVYFVPI
jgi:hypothetical protein